MNKSTKMFKELGYKKRAGTNLIYVKRFFSLIATLGPIFNAKQIEFCKNLEEIYIMEETTDDYRMSLDELKAINQQCKELGWL